MKEVFVGNVSFDVNDTDLKELYAKYGPEVECQLIKDRFTGKSKGFAFVKFPNEEDAHKAVAETNGFVLKGRPLNVRISEPREKSFGSGPRSNGDRGGFGAPRRNNGGQRFERDGGHHSRREHHHGGHDD